MLEQGLTKNQIIASLTRSTHGNYADYVPLTQGAIADNPEFLAHLIAYNEIKGTIRDSKVAIPIITLADASFDAELLENSLAHLALLSPRNLVKALHFAKDLKTPGRTGMLKRLIKRYLREREAVWGWWERTAVSHRASLQTLYALNRIKPSEAANRILFKRDRETRKRVDYPAGSVFADIKALPTMSAHEAAGVIMGRKLPFLVLMGALGPRLKETDIALALIDRMSATELVTNTKMLERLGVTTIPELRSAFESGLKRVAESDDVGFKAQRAAEVLSEDQTKPTELSGKLAAAQTRTMKRNAVEGDWLVLGDCSGSMTAAIDGARRVAATLAMMVKGDVHLVFFNFDATNYDVSGKDYDEVLKLTARVRAGGATSIGRGLSYAREHGWNVDGIAIVSDAQENTSPFFVAEYQALTQTLGKEVPVYLYRYWAGRSHWMDKDLGETMRAAGLDLQEFAMGQVDHYSLPNIVATMRTQIYSLADEIMDTPLLTIDQVFEKKTA